jgi:hypothetical protein
MMAGRDESIVWERGPAQIGTFPHPFFRTGEVIFGQTATGESLHQLSG